MLCLQGTNLLTRCTPFALGNKNTVIQIEAKNESGTTGLSFIFVLNFLEQERQQPFALERMKRFNSRIDIKSWNFVWKFIYVHVVEWSDFNYTSYQNIEWTYCQFFIYQMKKINKMEIMSGFTNWLMWLKFTNDVKCIWFLLLLNRHVVSCFG